MRQKRPSHSWTSSIQHPAQCTSEEQLIALVLDSLGPTVSFFFWLKTSGEWLKDPWLNDFSDAARSQRGSLMKRNAVERLAFCKNTFGNVFSVERNGSQKRLSWPCVAPAGVNGKRQLGWLSTRTE